MTDPFTDRQNRGTHKHGQKSERKTAKRFGVPVQPGSGAVDGAKGDFGLTEFLVENKCTEHRSISLKADWLDKISREARAEGKAAALAIQFVDRTGASHREDRWVMIREDEFNELLEAIRR